MLRKKIIGITLVAALWAPVKPFFIPEKAARGIAIFLGTAAAGGMGAWEWHNWEWSDYGASIIQQFENQRQEQPLDTERSGNLRDIQNMTKRTQRVYNVLGGILPTLRTLGTGAGVFIFADGYLAHYTVEGSLAIAKMNVNALMSKLNENQFFSNEFTNEDDLALFIDTALGNKKSALIDISKQIKGFLGTTKKILAATNKLINEAKDADIIAEAKELQLQVEVIEHKIKNSTLLLLKTPQFKELGNV